MAKEGANGCDKVGMSDANVEATLKTFESIQNTALSQSSGATTLTLKQTHSLGPHSNYDRNTLGICGTSWLSVS